MAVQLGTKGLANVDLVIVQGASFSATFTHVDESGASVDHSGWTFRARIKANATLDDCLSADDAGNIFLSIPASVTALIPTGDRPWDLMGEDANGNIVRIAYGTASVCDSYAFDE